MSGLAEPSVAACCFRVENRAGFHWLKRVKRTSYWREVTNVSITFVYIFFAAATILLIALDAALQYTDSLD
jgi:hypothetical protein